MGLNDTPSGERVQIAFFGVRNAGKSSLVNAVTGQSMAVVSAVAGTTTDPVRRAMELLPLGPVVIVDTPGFDDEGTLGELRVEATRKVLATCDVAVLVVDAARGFCETDAELLALFSEQGIPCVIALAKSDLVRQAAVLPAAAGAAVVRVSSITGAGIGELKETLARVGTSAGTEPQLIADLLDPGDMVVLVVPIDSAAPKGRLILPQQQVIRDVLEAGACAAITRDAELARTLAALPAPPRMVVTDSQVFGSVARTVPADVPLTSFSILFSRYKGDLAVQVAGAQALDALADGSHVLICEGCTHHRQCEDIGTVKMPRWVREHAGADPVFEFVSGGDFPTDLAGYDLVIHCGGCTLGSRAMRGRVARARDQGVPFTNYGVAIAHMHGILPRVIEPFGL
ncbi:[FeFe] hydrogenase H-cluster maturation GTPase HydF [Coriobacteriales bacterium OH1046]|nr:[FeFe] hydrogenase H-cluster maturation GTPase HydF [Coriobacteriales bacterium OH1046]